MSFIFNWAQLATTLSATSSSSPLLEQLEQCLKQAVSPSSPLWTKYSILPPPLTEPVSVKNINYGSSPPTLQLLEVNEPQIKGETQMNIKMLFQINYDGNCEIGFISKVESNLLKCFYVDKEPEFTSPGFLLAGKSSVLPLEIKVSEIKLDGNILVSLVLNTPKSTENTENTETEEVFDMSIKEATLFFKNNPIKSMVIKSSFDQISELISSEIRNEMLNVIKEMIVVDLPQLIHEVVQSNQNKYHTSKGEVDEKDSSSTMNFSSIREHDYTTHPQDDFNPDKLSLFERLKLFTLRFFFKKKVPGYYRNTLSLSSIGDIPDYVQCASPSMIKNSTNDDNTTINLERTASQQPSISDWIQMKYEQKLHQETNEQKKQRKRHGKSKRRRKIKLSDIMEVKNEYLQDDSRSDMSSSCPSSINSSPYISGSSFTLTQSPYLPNSRSSTPLSVNGSINSLHSPISYSHDSVASGMQSPSIDLGSSSQFSPVDMSRSGSHNSSTTVERDRKLEKYLAMKKPRRVSQNYRSFVEGKNPLYDEFEGSNTSTYNEEAILDDE